MHRKIVLKTPLIYVNTNCLKICLQRHQYLTRDSIRVPWTRKLSHTTELTDSNLPPLHYVRKFALRVIEY